MDSVLLKAQELSYSYHTLNGETPALDRVSFCLYRKEFLAIVGPSGCGKSTILSLIAGLLTPGSGGITFYGENGHQPGIGYMLQHDLLFEWRNVWQNVTLGLEIAHKDTVRNLERVRRMLSDYGLLEFQYKKPSQLSGGMRQRAALIRTMALEPDILLLDEPFSALDYQTRLTVSADIAAMIRKAEKSVILITHDLAEAISLADRVLILSARPARVKAEFPIHLTAADHSPLAARRAPEYGQLLIRSGRNCPMKTTDQTLSDQQLFLLAHRRHHHFVHFARIFMLLLFLTVWELFADFHIIDSFFFSSPSRVVACFVRMVSERSLFTHIGITLTETVISFFSSPSLAFPPPRFYGTAAGCLKFWSRFSSF